MMAAIHESFKSCQHYELPTTLKVQEHNRSLGLYKGPIFCFLTSDLLVLMDLTGTDGQASQEEGQKEDKTRDKGWK